MNRYYGWLDAPALLLVLCTIECSNARATAPTPAKPLRLVTREIAPLSFSATPSDDPDWPGDASINVEPTTGELEVKVLSDEKFYYLESHIALRGVKQSILETDANGKLTKDALFTGTPFIRFFLPGQTNPKIINLTCDPKSCTGTWKHFPFDPSKAQSFDCSVNVRGLQGKKWSLLLNQVIPERGLVQTMPDTKEIRVTDQKAAKYRQSILRTRLYTKGAYLPPGATTAVEPNTIDEWELQTNSDNTSGLGYIRAPRWALYEVLVGPLMLEVSEGAVLESFEIKAGERAWIRPGMVHALRSQTAAGTTARVRRLEFSY